MSPELYRFKKNLIDKKNHEAAEQRRIDAENQHMNEQELSFMPLFILVIVMCLVAIATSPR